MNLANLAPPRLAVCRAAFVLIDRGPDQAIADLRAILEAVRCGLKDDLGMADAAAARYAADLGVAIVAELREMADATLQ